MLKKLPIGIQTFEKIIRGDYLYVDKTKYIYNLITQGTVYFLSRPRRFGKSLLVSTLENLFQGNKELFKNLWITKNTDYKFEKHPVIKISFGGVLYENENVLKEHIKISLQETASKYKIKLEQKSFHSQFRELIIKLSKINKVVILIDEYDKAILDVITNKKLAEANRATLRAFYTQIKESDEYLKFVLLTGVSKFAKTSIFSGLNNLQDISMHSKYGEMLGYTQDELEFYFKEYIQELTKKDNSTQEAILTKMKKWYNGYQFTPEQINKVYNPFSILLLCSEQMFKNYWFETATPTFLLNILEQNQYNIQDIENLEVAEIAFSSFEIERIAVEPLLYQTGYITIKGYDKQNELYTLGYPNHEVKNSFLQHLADEYSGVRKEFARSYIVKLIRSLKEQNFDEFFQILKVFYTNVPYDIHIPLEKYYQTIFYLIFSMLGLEIDVEIKTNTGRCDAVVKMPSSSAASSASLGMTKTKTKTKTAGITEGEHDLIYIFEFKLGKTADVALAQIKEKKYADKYLSASKDIYLIGVSFDIKKKNIGEYKIEKL